MDYKIKNILVPFDFTHGALNAQKVADKFAVDFNSRIHLVNIIEPFFSHGLSRSYPEPMINLAEYAERSRNAIEKHLVNNSLNPMAYCYSVEYGFCSSTLINLNVQRNYDLIIIPDDTKSYISQLISKYNPLKIMEKVSTPLISVNKYYRVVDFRNVILPIRNLANWYDKLPFMVSLAKQTDGKIHAAGIVENKLANSKEFNSIFDSAIAILEHENVLGNIEKFAGEKSLNELILFSEKQKGDLIAITPPQKNGLIKSIFNPPLYSRLIANSPAPLFGVRNLI